MINIFAGYLTFHSTIWIIGTSYEFNQSLFTIKRYNKNLDNPTKPSADCNTTTKSITRVNNTIKVQWVIILDDTG